jgi:RimJ/RimL family protein N-acetyltransferase
MLAVINLDAFSGTGTTRAWPDIANGIVWIWTIRHRETPDNLIGLICLYDVEDNDRGFWLAPEYQGKGFMEFMPY